MNLNMRSEISIGHWTLSLINFDIPICHDAFFGVPSLPDGCRDQVHRVMTSRTSDGLNLGAALEFQHKGLLALFSNSD